MFSLLSVSLWCPANTSASQARGSGFKYHILPFFILNSVEFPQNLIRKNSIIINYGNKCKEHCCVFSFVMGYGLQFDFGCFLARRLLIVGLVESTENEAEE